jgi:hypothetical protein
MARYSWEADRSLFSVLVIGYDNRWNASDQVPRRLTENDDLSRFAQVDSSLGGASSRYALAASWTTLRSASSHRLQLYGMHYDLDLYSNFTYFLDNPVDGDQIQQRDRARKIVGGGYRYTRTMGQHIATVGLQSRLDLADVALRRARQRELRETIRADEVAEWGTGLYLELRSDWTPRLRTVFGARADAYRFDVRSDRAENSGVASDAILSPKVSVMFEPWGGTEIYVGGGYGFHSNDARGTVQSVDPASGDAVERVDPLARSRGAEIGLRTSPTEDWRSTFTLWTVELESELLFVGDAGTTEPSDASRRTGITWANFWRPTSQLRVDLDASLARARFHELPDGENRIPGALERVVTAGLAWEPSEGGPFAAVRFRHFGDYPLNEDNSVRASATSLLNVKVGWALGEVRVGASLMNLLDSADADIAYFYGSRVAGEPDAGVEDVHFHPVEPRQLRVTLSWGY